MHIGNAFQRNGAISSVVEFLTNSLGENLFTSHVLRAFEVALIFLHVKIEITTFKISHIIRKTFDFKINFPLLK